MPQLININIKKETSFTSEAATILENERCSQVSQETFTRTSKNHADINSVWK